MRTKIALALALLTSSASVATAQSDCDAALAATDNTEETQSADRRRADFNYFCSHTFNDTRRAWGAKADGRYGAIAGSGAYNENSYKVRQSELCTIGNREEHESSFRYYMGKYSGRALESWDRCKANEVVFNCWAEASGENIAVRTRLSDPRTHRITRSYLSDGARLLSPASSIAPGTQVEFGTQRIITRRVDEKKIINFYMDVSDGVSKSCKISVIPFAGPDTLPRPTPTPCERTGSYDFYGNKCGDGYRIAGTVAVVNFGIGSSTIVPLDVPDYRADVGRWFAGDFDGDGVTDLVHIVLQTPGIDPYLHVHYSDGKGSFARPTASFNFRTHANPRGDYNANIGQWEVRYDPMIKADVLYHHTGLGPRIHVWRPVLNDQTGRRTGAFVIGLP